MKVNDNIMNQIATRTYTRRPGESSVYRRSIVFDEPPAPAARAELGFAACDAAALRLFFAMNFRDHEINDGDII